MAIQYVGGQVGGRAGAASTTTVTYALTGGLASVPAAGDFVVVTMVVGSAGRNPAQAVTAPGTWSNLGQLNPNTQTYDTSMNVSYKFMGTTPDTNLTAPSTGNAQDAQRWTIQVFRGVDSTNPLDVAAVAASAVGTGRPDPGSITPTTAGAWVVICGGAAAATGAAFTAPANYTTNFLTGTTADTNDATVGSGYRAWTSGAENPAQYTGGTTNAVDSWAAYTIALRPQGNDRTVALTGAQVTASAGTVTKSNTGNVTLSGAQVTASAGNVTASQADPNKPILISTTLWQQDLLGTSGTPGAKSITVPADAQGVVVQFHMGSGGGNALSISSDFAGTFTIANSSAQNGCSLGHAVVSSTGAKNLTLSWTQTTAEGPSVYISFIKNINTSDWVREVAVVGNDINGTSATNVFDTSADDLLLVVNDQDGGTTPATISGFTSLATTGGTYSLPSRLQSCDSPGATTTTVTGTTTNFDVLSGISIKPASGGNVNVTLTGAQATASAGTLTASQQVSKALTGAQVAASAGTLIASQANPNTPIRISTVLWQQDTLGTSGTPGAKAITVPVDAQGVIVQVASTMASVAPSLSITSDFSNAFTVINSNDQDGCSVGYAEVTSTGSKNLTLAWTESLLEGPSVYISFIKNINLLNWVRATLAESTGAASGNIATSISSGGTDLILVVDEQDGASGTPSAMSGCSTLATTDGTYGSASRFQSVDNPSGGSTSLTGVSTHFATMTAVSIKQSGGDVNVVLSGSQATASAGTLAASQQVSKALTGAQATASAGNLAKSLSLPLTGAQAAASAGTLTASQQVSKALTGEQVTASAGTLTASQQVSKALTGVQVAAQAGTITTSQQLSRTLTGAQVAAAAGSVTASQQVSKALTGVQVAAQAGTLTASQQVSKALTGAQVTASAGTITASQSTNDVNIALTGAQVAAQAGNLTSSQQVSKALTGAQVTASAGDITTSQLVSLALTGAQAAAQAGTLVASQQVSKVLTGAQVTASAGNLGKSVSLALTGAQVTAGAGTITTSQTSFVALTGAQVAAEAGSLSTSQTKTVALTGAQVAAQAGTVGKQFELFRALTGAESSAQAGTLATSQQVSKALTGEQAAAQAGDLGTAQALTRALTGAQVAVSAGSLVAQREFFASLSGAQVTASAGLLSTSQALTRVLTGAQAVALAGDLDAGVSLMLFVNIPLQGAQVVTVSGRLGVVPSSQYPSPGNVAAGVKYGPTGVEFTGTMVSAGYNRARVVNE